MAGLEELVQTVLERQNLLHFEVIQETLVNGKQRCTHQRDGQRAVLGLLEQLGHAGAAVELLAGGFVQIGGELRKRCQLTVLGQVGTDTAGLALMILVCAAEPTRDTEIPALMAGRIPALNRLVSRKIWPSVIEITFVGTKADTSPACVSMMGSAVSEPSCP